MSKTIFTGENQTVVAVIRRARLRRQVSQSRLGAAIGRDQSYISLIECSQRRVDVVEFIKICRALDEEPSAVLQQILEELGG